jgi:hypothetical protein
LAKINGKNEQKQQNKMQISMKNKCKKIISFIIWLLFPRLSVFPSFANLAFQ